MIAAANRHALFLLAAGKRLGRKHLMMAISSKRPTNDVADDLAQLILEARMSIGRRSAFC